jgi:hypothetical protein
MEQYIPESGKVLLTYDVYTGQFEYVEPDMVSSNPNKPDARQVAIARAMAVVTSYYSYQYFSTHEPFKDRHKVSIVLSSLILARVAYYLGQHLTPKQS